MKYNEFKERLFSLRKLRSKIKKLKHYKESVFLEAFIDDGEFIEGMEKIIETVADLEIDPVSKIAITRGYFEHLYLWPLAKYCFQNPCSLYVLGLDLVNLKKINEKYGHKVGDLYIKEGIETLYSQIKKRHPQNLVVRWGGDEFVVFIVENKEEIGKNFNNSFSFKVKYKPKGKQYFVEECISGSFRYYMLKVPETKTPKEFILILEETIYKTLDMCKRKTK